MSGPPPRYVYINPTNGGYELYLGLEEYMRYYNFERPHDSLKKISPAEMYNTKDNIIFLTKYSTINSASLV